jgi:hypothetical protein
MFYDPDYDFLSLGVFSALYEIYYLRELDRLYQLTIPYYFMGFYIDTCQKMSYKSHYRPSQLLDPFRYTWVNYDQVIKWVRKRRFTFLDAPEDIFQDDETWKQHIISEKERNSHIDPQTLDLITLSIREKSCTVKVRRGKISLFFTSPHFHLL